MTDECITWKDHIRTVENKIAKSIGLLYQAKQLLNTSSLKSIYFYYVSNAWASTQKNKKTVKSKLIAIENEVLLILFLKSSIFNSYSLNTNQSKS